MVASWNSAIQSYRLRVNQAVEERHQAREAVRQFKIQNNLMAGREPQVHKKQFQIVKILVPIVLFFTENIHDATPTRQFRSPSYSHVREWKLRF